MPQSCGIVLDLCTDRRNQIIRSSLEDEFVEGIQVSVLDKCLAKLTREKAILEVKLYNGSLIIF